MHQNVEVKKIVGNSYRQDYLQNQNKALLPLIMSTSGRLHGEFVRLLHENTIVLRLLCRLNPHRYLSTGLYDILVPLGTDTGYTAGRRS